MGSTATCSNLQHDTPPAQNQTSLGRRVAAVKSFAPNQISKAYQTLRCQSLEFGTLHMNSLERTIPRISVEFVRLNLPKADIGKFSSHEDAIIDAKYLLHSMAKSKSIL